MPISLPNCIGDSRRLRQVILNLVRNAMKFTRNGGIRISANFDKSDKSLVIKVKDTGVGIKKEDMNLLFSQFGRLHRTA